MYLRIQIYHVTSCVVTSKTYPYLIVEFFDDESKSVFAMTHEIDDFNENVIIRLHVSLVGVYQFNNSIGRLLSSYFKIYQSFFDRFSIREHQHSVIRECYEVLIISHKFSVFLMQARMQYVFVLFLFLSFSLFYNSLSIEVNKNSYALRTAIKHHIFVLSRQIH